MSIDTYTNAFSGTMDTYTRPDSAIWIPVQALYMHTLLVGGTAQRFQPSVNTHGLDVCRHTRPSRGRIPQGLPSAEAVGGTPQSTTPLAETVSGGCPEGHPLTVSYSSHVHRSCRARNMTGQAAHSSNRSFTVNIRGSAMPPHTQLPLMY